MPPFSTAADHEKVGFIFMRAKLPVKCLTIQSMDLQKAVHLPVYRLLHS